MWTLCQMLSRLQITCTWLTNPSFDYLQTKDVSETNKSVFKYIGVGGLIEKLQYVQNSVYFLFFIQQTLTFLFSIDDRKGVPKNL